MPRLLRILFLLLLAVAAVILIMGVYIFAPRLHSIRRTIYKAKGTSCHGNLQKLKKILIAVQYNNAFYESIEMLNTFYEPVFAKVVFCGNHYNDSINLIHSPDSNGYQGYNCLRKAITMHPGYEGYLFTNDDALIFWWNLVKYDIRKFWIMENFFHPIKCYYDLTSAESNGWTWWNSNKVPGLPKLCKQAINKVLFSTWTKEAKDINLKTYIQNRKITCQDSNLCFCGFVDTFYVPKNETKAFVFLSDIFYDKTVYLEAAVPTIMSFLVDTKKKNFQVLNGTQLGLIAGYNSDSYVSGRAFYEHMKFTNDYIHPIKFGSHKISSENIDFFKNAVIPYGKQFIESCNFDMEQDI